jgi:hypothetical protein
VYRESLQLEKRAIPAAVRRPLEFALTRTGRSAADVNKVIAHPALPLVTSSFMTGSPSTALLAYGGAALAGQGAARVSKATKALRKKVPSTWGAKEWEEAAAKLGSALIKVAARRKKKKPTWSETNPGSRAVTSPSAHAVVGGVLGGVGGYHGRLKSHTVKHGLEAGKVVSLKGGVKGALLGAGLVGTAAAITPAVRRWFAARGTVGRLRKARREGKPVRHYLNDTEKQYLQELKKR